MDNHQTDHTTDTDQTDHIPPYKHEITISVGGADDNNTKYQPAVITPTPSPRSLQSNQTGDVISSNSTDDDNAVLTRSNKNDNKPNGVDNPAFDNDNTTSPRPLSSFGQNGVSEVNSKEHSNGKSGDKPLGKNNKRIQIKRKKLERKTKIFCLILEAVNLELVNLNTTPSTNGHRDNGLPQKKKDTERVEIGNSYNEYFVPVNEHKKYIRYFGYFLFVIV